MALRIPGHLSDNGVDPPRYELLQEMAHSLGRAGRRAQEALAAAAACNGGGDREELVARAGEALWYFVVQREACGLRDSETVLAEMRVPGEVILQMGPYRPRFPS